MAGIHAEWIDGQRFLFTDEAGHSVMTDPDGNGFKPPDLLLASLVGCAGVDVLRILEKKRKTITSIEVKASKQNAPDPPWTIEKIEMEWVVKGPGLSEKAVRDAVHLSEEKYCSVSASLKSEVVIQVRVLDEGEEGD